MHRNIHYCRDNLDIVLTPLLLIYYFLQQYVEERSHQLAVFTSMLGFTVSLQIMASLRSICTERTRKKRGVTVHLPVMPLEVLVFVEGLSAGHAVIALYRLEMNRPE